VCAAAILDRNLIRMAKRLHDEELYSTECADELVTFFARRGVSTLKGALSTLMRPCHAPPGVCM
jgi:hypothetical protein